MSYTNFRVIEKPQGIASVTLNRPSTSVEKARAQIRSQRQRFEEDF